MLKRLPFFILALFLTTFGYAQISHGGQPIAFDDRHALVPVSFLEFTAENLDQLKAEDAINDQYKDIPYRFGANIPVSLTMEDGQWTELESGGRVWRMGISSPGATSINFNFSTYNVPKGGRLYVYDADHREYIGSFTHENMQPHGGLGVSLLKSDRIVLEYIESAKVEDEAVLEIDQITHGYRGILHKFEEAVRGPFGNSGSCNINVACPESEGWEDQIRSVALIVSGGNAICTGSMVNNTAEDGTPYFLTANHCLGGSVGNWVFYFNHESASCQGNSGPTNQTVSGAQLRASNSGSDFGLLELNNEPPQSYDVFFNGWDRSGNAPTGQTCIHHPSGDLKKITHDFDPATESVDAGAQTWFINEWEEGTTEPGSSGSPLFDQNGRVIGQLYGGVASCSNDSYDYYGRFDVSWDGSSASNRLRDWLDPLGSEPLVLDGLGGAPLLPNDASALGISGVGSVLCNQSSVAPTFTLRNNGLNLLTSAVIELVLNGSDAGTLDWTGSLASGESEMIQLPQLNLINGVNVLTVSVSQPNGEPDGNTNNNLATFEFTAYIDAVIYELELILDEYGSETSWVVADENSNVLYAGGPFENDVPGQIESESLCLGAGECYTLTIQDEWGDGMCCDFEEGSYTLYDQFGNEVTTGGEFDFEESSEFCITAVSVSENAFQNAFSIFPNPANSEVSLQIPGTETGKVELMITDITGRVVMFENLVGATNMHTFGVEGWSKGLYFVQVTRNGQKAVKRLVVTQ